METRAASSSSTPADDVRASKQLLRKEIRSRLRGLSREEVLEQSQQVWEKLFQLPEYQEAKSVGLFLSMPSGEIATDPALKDCVDKGKVIYVPQVGKNFEIADMELLRVFYDDKDESDKIFHHAWPRNKWGIPEPPPEMPVQAASPGDIDLLVVPGLGFDKKGNRLGQGKGYYDRFIARMVQVAKGSKPPFLVAVGLDCQLVEKIPVQDYDRRMDMVLLPSETLNE